MLAVHIVGRNPRNMVLFTTRRLMGFRPCALLVEHGKHVAMPPSLHPMGKYDIPLFDQITTISDGAFQGDLLGKCFPIGPRHACMTLHQVVPLPPYEDFMVTRIAAIHRETRVVFQVPTPKSPANVTDKAEDFVILELETKAKSFEKWLYPVPSNPDKPIFCPAVVPTGDLVAQMEPKLIAAWEDQGVVVTHEQDEIARFFKTLGKPGSMVTLKGEIAHQYAGLIGVRIPTWSSMSGGFITHDSGMPSTFCGIMCCSGASDKKSNFNAAVAVDNIAFKAMYADAVLPTLGNLPDATKQLLA